VLQIIAFLKGPVQVIHFPFFGNKIWNGDGVFSGLALTLNYSHYEICNGGNPIGKQTSVTPGMQTQIDKYNLAHPRPTIPNDLGGGQNPNANPNSGIQRATVPDATSEHKDMVLRDNKEDFSTDDDDK
jgi:hypothetical protein